MVPRQSLETSTPNRPRCLYSTRGSLGPFDGCQTRCPSMYRRGLTENEPAGGVVRQLRGFAVAVFALALVGLNARPALSANPSIPLTPVSGTWGTDGTVYAVLRVG